MSCPGHSASWPVVSLKDPLRCPLPIPSYCPAHGLSAPQHTGRGPEPLPSSSSPAPRPALAFLSRRLSHSLRGAPHFRAVSHCQACLAAPRPWCHSAQPLWSSRWQPVQPREQQAAPAHVPRHSHSRCQLSSCPPPTRVHWSLLPPAALYPSALSAPLPCPASLCFGASPSLSALHLVPHPL